MGVSAWHPAGPQARGAKRRRDEKFSALHAVKLATAAGNAQGRNDGPPAADGRRLRSCPDDALGGSPDTQADR